MNARIFGLTLLALTSQAQAKAADSPQDDVTDAFSTPEAPRKQGLDFYLTLGTVGSNRFGGPHFAGRLTCGYRWPYFGLYVGYDLTFNNNDLYEANDTTFHYFFEPHIFLINNDALALSINPGLGVTDRNHRVAPNTYQTDTAFGGRLGVGLSFNITKAFYIPIDAHLAGGIEGFNGQVTIGVGFVGP